MTDGYNLFEAAQAREAFARSSDPESSHEAAAGVNVSYLEGVVLRVLRECGPMTIHEIAERTTLSLVTVSPRTAPLARKRLIRFTGEFRESPSGRRRRVWEAL